MITVISASGTPIMISAATKARLVDGLLVCLDSAGQRVISFDPVDVVAFAVEAPGEDAQWVMGGPALEKAEKGPRERRGLPWRLSGVLRPMYR